MTRKECVERLADIEDELVSQYEASERFKEICQDSPMSSPEENAIIDQYQQLYDGIWELYTVVHGSYRDLLVEMSQT